MRRKGRTYGDSCWTALALDGVGERWVLLVVHELILGPKRFADLCAGAGRRSRPSLSVQQWAAWSEEAAPFAGGGSRTVLSRRRDRAGREVYEPVRERAEDEDHIEGGEAPHQDGRSHANAHLPAYA